MRREHIDDDEDWSKFWAVGGLAAAWNCYGPDFRRTLWALADQPPMGFSPRCRFEHLPQEARAAIVAAPDAASRFANLLLGALVGRDQPRRVRSDTGAVAGR